jgi:hypothetical protein
MALIDHTADERRDPDRDPVLERAYAQSPRDEPPARLDDPIRAAARREVHARPRSLRAMLRSWRMPVSIAAILVLSASLVMLMKEGADDFYGGPVPDAVRTEQYYEPPPSAAPITTPAAPKGAPEGLASAPAAPAAPAAKTDGRMEQAKEPSRDMQRQVESVLDRAQPSAIPPSAPAEARQAAPPPQAQANSPGDVARSRTDSAVRIRGSAAQSVEGDAGVRESPKALREQRAAEADAGVLSRRQSTTSQEAARSAAVPAPAANAARPELGAAAPASPAPVWAGFERQPPEKWVERIGELRRAGRETEAREMLEELRKRFPEYPLPAALTR